MPFEEFDDKVKQAADHHHPAYDEQAWTKMEKLLDKHLPQEEKRKRRLIFFLLFFLLLGGGAWLLVSKPWQGNRKIADAKPESVQNSTAETSKTSPVGNIQKNPVEALPNNPVESDKENITEAEENKLPQTNRTAAYNKADKNPPVNLKNSLADKEDKKFVGRTKAKDARTPPDQRKGKPADIHDDNAKKNLNPTGVENVVSSSQPGTTNIVSPANQPVANENKPVSSLPKETTEEKKDEPKNIAVAKMDEPVKKETPLKKPTAKNKKANSFFFSLSAGPDMSFVSSGIAGTTKFLTGGGIGYIFNNRLTVRTGFYTARKIYTAAPDAYNPPASFWTYYPYLEKVDADCKVYEIPLSLSYSFGNKPKQNWFASAGISSLLMKKETYNYYYKYAPYAPTINKTWTIEDENKHYFSVLTLSGGYQKHIGK
ncbi:MAG: hypothetical protein AAB221_10280, partial [Bacteroidota bacterium]